MLPAGTWIEHVQPPLADAEQRQLPFVVVRTVDDEGWVALQRIATASLRRAVG